MGTRTQGQGGAAPPYRTSIGEIWLRQALLAMVATQQIAISLTPDAELVVLNDSAVQHGYRSYSDLITAFTAVVQGAAQKRIGVSLAAGVALTPSLPLNADLFSGFVGAAVTEGVRVFGWRIRLTASQLNFPYRPIQIDVGPLVGAAGPTVSLPNPVLSLVVTPRKAPVDVIVLSPSNAAGLFTVTVGGSASTVAAPADTTVSNGVAIRSIADANVFAMVESLNQRDLTKRVIGGASVEADFSGFYDNVFPGMRDSNEVFPGMRDHYR